VQLRQPLPMRCFSLDLVSLLERRQQRLRLGDLKHFRRGSEAFERRCEHGVRLRVTAGAAIELGHRQRRAQTPAPRALLLGDRDGGQERFFRRRGIGRVAFPQEFASRAM
jgi:hypothetical protein